MNKYKIYANLVVVLHTLIVVINHASLPVLFFNYNLGLLFAASAVLAPLSWIVLNDHCVLTTLEKKLRAKYNPEHVYREGFIAHYFKSWFGIRITNFLVTVFIWSYLAL